MFTKKLISGICSTMVLACSMVSCTDEEGIIGSLTDPNLPEGVTPSEEMTYGNAKDEIYVDYAAKYNIKSSSSEYSSIEFFGDGTYLLTKKGAENLLRQPVIAAESSGRGLMLGIPRSSQETRVAADEYFIYGGYKVINSSNYVLDEIDSLFIKEGVENEYQMIFKNENSGIYSTVYANKQNTDICPSTKSLCRTWDVKNWEQWFYLNTLLISHSKYYGEIEGQDSHYEGDILNSPSSDVEEYFNLECLKVIFSSSGTYICFFRNGTKDVRIWHWGNEKKGILYFDWDNPDIQHAEGYVTLRFKGNEARMYEDYMMTKEDMEEQLGDDFDEDEIGNLESVRILHVTTLKAAK